MTNILVNRQSKKRYPAITMALSNNKTLLTLKQVNY